MDRQRIKEIALAKGFKLKVQPNGSEDLNPYVYDTIEAVIAEEMTPLMDAMFLSIRQAARVGLMAETVEQREDVVLGQPTLTRNAHGELVAVTLQNDEHQIQQVLWERS